MDSEQVAIDRIRRIITSALEEFGPTGLAQRVGVGAQTLVDFSRETVNKPRATNWTLIRKWALQNPKIRSDPVRSRVVDADATPSTSAELTAYAQAVHDMLVGVADAQLKLIDKLRRFGPASPSPVPARDEFHVVPDPGPATECPATPAPQQPMREGAVKPAGDG